LRSRLVVLALASLMATVLFAAPALAIVETLEANMTGQKVVGGGDPNGTGDAKVIVHPNKVCYVLRTDDVRKPTAAYIRTAPRGKNGPVVAYLKVPRGGYSSGCITDRPLAKALRLEPGKYYVEVDSKRYPDGAVRGQLTN
jgi:hypothetical protein